jgi:hypothetical protein
MCGCISALRRLFADFRFLCGGGRWGRQVEVGTHAHEEGILTKYLLSLISYLRNLVGRLADMHKMFSVARCHRKPCVYFVRSRPTRSSPATYMASSIDTHDPSCGSIPIFKVSDEHSCT